MVQSRLGLKALGLCALVFGLMAFAASAQAETGAKWGILQTNNQLVTIAPESEGGIGHKLLPTVSAVIDGASATLLTEVLKKKVDLTCTGVTIEEGKLELLGKVGEGRATFSGCTTKIGGVLQPVCKPHSAGAAEGTIKSEKAYGLMKLHSGTPTVLFLPVAGETFVTIILGKEGVENECSIGEKLPVSGKLSVKDNNNLFATHEVKHLIVEFAALTDLWVLNKTAEHKATVDGAAEAFLTGEHLNIKWAGLV